MLYFDTSALVPIFVSEVMSAKMNTFLDSTAMPIHISDLCIAEFGSAISRRKRTGDDPQVVALERLKAFDEWFLQATTRLAVQPLDIIKAGLLVRQFELRLPTPDAIHLAICERAGLTLVTLDNQLAQAAEVLAIGCLVPA